MVGSSLLAVAAGLLIAAYLGGFWPQAGELPLVDLADKWQGELAVHPAAWRSMAQAPAAFPLPTSILATAQSWQPINTVRGVAYKLVHSKGAEAILYAVRLRRSGLPLAPLANPQSTTGGRAVGYWQSGAVIYVLVVPGDERSYRRFISGGTTPLAAISFGRHLHGAHPRPRAVLLRAA